MTRKDQFFRERPFFEKLCDGRELLNRQRYFRDLPVYESVDPEDFAKAGKVLEELQENGIIGNWIIGGGTALTYYTTSIPTIDVDVFAYYTAGSMFEPFGQLYPYLIENYGAKVDHEMIKVGKVYFQFLPLDTDNPVDAEAVKHPNVVKGGIRIFKLEYIICSMLYLKAPKYDPRLVLLKSEKQYDEKELRKLLKKFDLEEEWDDVPERTRKHG